MIWNQDRCYCLWSNNICYLGYFLENVKFWEVKKWPYFKLKFNYDRVGVQQNPFSINPFEKFCFGNWHYLPLNSIFVETRRCLDQGTEKNQVPCLLPIGVGNVQIQQHAKSALALTKRYKVCFGLSKTLFQRKYASFKQFEAYSS